MKSFDEYQTLATAVPAALRNNRTRIVFPVLGLQQGAGSIGSLLASGLPLTPKQCSELQDRLSDVLWYLALICGESGISLQSVAEYSVSQLEKRRAALDPEKR